MGTESNGVHDDPLVRHDPAHWPGETGWRFKTVPGVPHGDGNEPDLVPDLVLPPSSYQTLKRAFDWVGAGVLLVLTLPVMAIAGLLVKLTSPGPMLYTQMRVGRGGRRPYLIYKIRTMSHNCERETGPRWAGALEAHITPVGRVLRRLHLDELPQLWNVLKGDMSLVGPRPERPEFVSLLAAAIPGYKERHAVRPGMTGLAQVQLPPDTDVDSVRRKLRYDLYYVHRCGFGLDLRILVSTAYYLARVPFWRVPPWFRVPSWLDVEAPLESTPGGTGKPRSGQQDTRISPETRVVPKPRRTGA